MGCGTEGRRKIILIMRQLGWDCPMHTKWGPRSGHEEAGLNLMGKVPLWDTQGQASPCPAGCVCVQSSLHCRQLDLALYPVRPACLHPASLPLTAHNHTRTSSPHMQVTHTGPGPWPLLVGDSAHSPETPPYSSDHTGHPRLPPVPAGPHSLSHTHRSPGRHSQL